MEKQVTILFAGAKGFLDAIPVDMLAEFEEQLYAHIEQNDPTVFDDLKGKMEIDATQEEKMKKAISAFSDSFKSAKGIN